MFWKSTIPLTNEGCWFSFCSGLLFRRQLSPRCSLRVSLKRRDWEIIWENALCGLSTLVGLRFILLSYGKACPPPPPPTLSLLSRSFFPFFFFSFCGLALVICSTQNQQKPQPLDWPYMWKSIQRNVALLLIKPGLSVCVCIWGSFFKNYLSKLGQWSFFFKAHGSTFISRLLFGLSYSSCFSRHGVTSKPSNLDAFSPKHGCNVLGWLSSSHFHQDVPNILL